MFAGAGSAPAGRIYTGSSYQHLRTGVRFGDSAAKIDE